MSKSRKNARTELSSPPVYPFSAIVGQEEMKLALTLNVIDSSVGGALLMGHRGTGKSTVVRALADLLPAIPVVAGCEYGCDPSDEKHFCVQCSETKRSKTKLASRQSSVPVVELPLGATEDRVCGTIDVERALRSGVKRFEPGLLARANRGFLYIDEVNLLEDHLVDLLLDVAATGVNKVERESISKEHPARFVLIGSGNPEEGELRPQLLDRFGLCVEVKTEEALDQRMEIVERRQAFNHDPDSFRLAFADEQGQLRKKIERARTNLANVRVERTLLKDIVRLCSELKIDGHRGELTITRAARALAAFEGRKKATDSDVKRVAVMSLRHRLRRDATEETANSARIEEALEKVLAKGGRVRGGGGGRTVHHHVSCRAKGSACLPALLAEENRP
ncbi:MAG: magnesium chelatase ATPase subunit I [Pyrinomonadaceae bacterium]